MLLNAEGYYDCKVFPRSQSNGTVLSVMKRTGRPPLPSEHLIQSQLPMYRQGFTRSGLADYISRVTRPAEQGPIRRFLRGLPELASQELAWKPVVHSTNSRGTPLNVMHHGPVTPEIAAGLLALKNRIEAAKIPSSKLDETINLAVWNIREFGKVRRIEPAIHYIAEILGQFDLIAIVELRDNLQDLSRVLCYLGPSWRVVYSDWIDDSGGNKERVAFLF
jgi:hypothetical protein